MTPPDPRPRDPLELVEDDADETPFSEVFREFIAFEVKLFLDGLKDIVLAPGAVVALFIGLLSRRHRDRPLRALMRLGERFEHWLGLYRPLEDESLDDVPFGGANRALKEAERRIRKSERRENP